MDRLLEPSSSSIPFTAVVNKDFKYLENDWIAEEIKCGICLFTWVNPIQLDCSHIFCRGCLKKQSEAKCAECRSVVKSVNEPHRALVNIVNSLPVKCLKKACTWNGKRQDYMKHVCIARVEELKADGDKLFEENDFEAAAKKYAEALGPTNSTISNFLHKCKEINEQTRSENEKSMVSRSVNAAQPPSPPQGMSAGTIFPSYIREEIKWKYTCSLCDVSGLTDTKTVSQHLDGSRQTKKAAKIQPTAVLVPSAPLTASSLFPPCILPQKESVKYHCTLCNVVVGSESAVSLHMQSKPHQKKVKTTATTATTTKSLTTPPPPTVPPPTVPPPTVPPPTVPPPTTLTATVPPPPPTSPTTGHLVRVKELVRAGDELLQKSEFQGAVNRYSEALELNPKNHSILCNRSLCYLHLKQRIKAQTDAQNAIRIDGTSALGYIRLAQVSMDEGKWSDAIVILETGSRLEPQNEEIQKLMQGCKARESQQKQETQQKKKFAQSVAQAVQNKSGTKESTVSQSPQPKGIATPPNKPLPQYISMVSSSTQLYQCSLCKVPMNGMHCVEQHEQGSSHSKAVKKQQSIPLNAAATTTASTTTPMHIISFPTTTLVPSNGSLPIQSCENVRVEPPLPATVTTIPITTTKPQLPADIEFVPPNHYYCTRCKIDIPGDLLEVLRHAQSTQHRAVTIPRSDADQAKR